MKQTNETRLLSRRIASFCFLVVMVILASVYHARTVRQRRLAASIAYINSISYAQPIWRCSGPVNALCAITGCTPPDACKGYVVQLNPEQVTDVMVDHLVALDSLDSLVIKTKSATGRAITSPLPIEQLPMAASRGSISRLTEKYPDLLLFVDPVSEFAPTNQAEGAE